MRISLSFTHTEMDLTIGITSWNSACFLGHAIEFAQRSLGFEARIIVLDNASTDDSVAIARKCGVEVIVRKCTQARALNYLLSLSRSKYTLLMHSDVILLNNIWFDLCTAEIKGNTALVSPEDIGCGLYTRPWGKNKPESSFLFFDTARAKASRDIFWYQRLRIKWPRRELDLYGEHVTYNLPEKLAKRGFGWRMMSVLPSSLEDVPLYTPPFKPKYWNREWGRLRYGLGNFYFLNGQITHYHNWFERVGLGEREFDALSVETVPPEGGIPKAYLQVSTARFLDDLENDKLEVPRVPESTSSKVCGA